MILIFFMKMYFTRRIRITTAKAINIIFWFVAWIFFKDVRDPYTVCCQSNFYGEFEEKTFSYKSCFKMIQYNHFGSTRLVENYSKYR